MGARSFRLDSNDGTPETSMAQPPRFEPPYETPQRDRLSEIDLIVQKRIVDEAESAERSAQETVDRADWSAAFSEACATRVRPAMEAVIERLRDNGGGGFIEERDEARSRLCSHRLTLWMSLVGEIEGTPRQNRHPYLQFDADPETHLVIVSEGDMWQGHGGERSGLAAQWTLPQLTEGKVTDEVVAILRRSAQ